MSARTGAPAARALARGGMEEIYGPNKKPNPTAPTTDVAAVRKRRRPELVLSPPIWQSPDMYYKTTSYEIPATFWPQQKHLNYFGIF
jgi:hypothetical protein